MGWFNHQLGEMSCLLVGFLLCEKAQFLHTKRKGPGIYDLPIYIWYNNIYIYIYMKLYLGLVFRVLVFGVLMVFFPGIWAWTCNSWLESWEGGITKVYPYIMTHKNIVEMINQGSSYFIYYCGPKQLALSIPDERNREAVLDNIDSFLAARFWWGRLLSRWMLPSTILGDWSQAISLEVQGY